LPETVQRGSQPVLREVAGHPAQGPDPSLLKWILPHDTPQDDFVTIHPSLRKMESGGSITSSDSLAETATETTLHAPLSFFISQFIGEYLTEFGFRRHHLDGFLDRETLCSEDGEQCLQKPLPLQL
jgi:hypothetical protein